MAAPHGRRWRRGSALESPSDLQQSVLQFASSTAHETLGPINQISSLVALFVQRYRGKLDDDADILLSHIEAARGRLESTANGVRKYFQVIVAQCGLAPVDMKAALDAALVPLERQIAECGAEIRADSLPVVEGDRELLILLFQIIVENALKFRRTDARPKVVVSADRSPQYVVIQVSDNGIGIDPRHRDVVFEAFKKLNGHAYPGAGLGLTMAQVIVELHGGNIWVEPAEGGTLLRFELPASHDVLGTTGDEGPEVVDGDLQ